MSLGFRVSGFKVQGLGFIYLDTVYDPFGLSQCSSDCSALSASLIASSGFGRQRWGFPKIGGTPYMPQLLYSAFTGTLKRDSVTLLKPNRRRLSETSGTRTCRLEFLSALRAMASFAPADGLPQPCGPNELESWGHIPL